MKKIALIGRPNVGKSTLFNRLVKKKLAIVDDQPGVTRDLREGEAKVLGQKVTIIDTAGMEDEKAGSLSARMRALTERAIDYADICIFLVDARVGITALDYDIAKVLRNTSKPIILALNKSEGHAGLVGFSESYRLGLGEPLPISAEHGENIDQLHQELYHLLNEEISDEADEELHEDLSFDSEVEFVDDEQKPIKVAVVGRPNAGKSTLINAILGEERLLTGPEAGITRDSIALDIEWNGRKFTFYDTAGMRKRAKVVDKVEGLSVSDGIRAAKYAEVIIVLIDSQSPFEAQDLRIADLMAREGRAVVLAANKWDLEENKSGRRPELNEMFERLLPQLRGADLIPISAQTGRGFDQLQQAIIASYQRWNMRIATAKLNDWIKGEVAHHPPPAVGGRRIKLRYITQVKSRPPSFVVKCSRASEVPESYKRYLINGLRNSFGLWGTPIRLSFRSDENPFDKS